MNPAVWLVSRKLTDLDGQRCGAVVVPLLSGGTRIKILEAALAGRPVLSTPVGAEGLDLVDGRDLLIFNNCEEFSCKFIDILDVERYNVLTGNAKRVVRSGFITPSDT
jgi:polysaccharide biosynthesis protein PslH